MLRRTVAPLPHYPYLNKLTLYLDAIGFPGDGDDCLAKALMALPALRSLQCFRIKFVNSFGHLTQLTSLGLYNCDIADTSLVTRLTGLTALTCLKTSLAHVLPQYTQLTALQQLRLEQIDHMQGSLAVFPLLTSCVCCKDIASAVRGMSQLVSLECRESLIPDAACLLDMPSLTTLQCDSLRGTANALGRLTLLRSLVCGGIDPQSALCLSSMQSLTTFSCEIDSCDQFARDVLPRLTTLTELDLSVRHHPLYPADFESVVMGTWNKWIALAG